MKQPKAVLLADLLDQPDEDGFSTTLDQEAATELRRLHALNQDMLAALKTAEACLYAHGKPIDPAITAAITKTTE